MMTRFDPEVERRLRTRRAVNVGRDPERRDVMPRRLADARVAAFEKIMAETRADRARRHDDRLSGRRG